jgi:hypothetical protein
MGCSAEAIPTGAVFQAYPYSDPTDMLQSVKVSWGRTGAPASELSKRVGVALEEPVPNPPATLLACGLADGFEHGISVQTNEQYWLNARWTRSVPHPWNDPEAPEDRGRPTRRSLGALASKPRASAFSARWGPSKKSTRANARVLWTTNGGLQQDLI